jgi:hypothetical protein
MTWNIHTTSEGITGTVYDTQSLFCRIFVVNICFTHQPLPPHPQFDTHHMATEFADTTAKLFPLGCCQKLDSVSDIHIREYLRDQQEHLQPNIVGEEVGETTIRNE